jgi:hypothetical protein
MKKSKSKITPKRISPKLKVTIGHILVWLGILAIIFLSIKFLIDEIFWIVLAILAIIIGGYWGMNKK